MLCGRGTADLPPPGPGGFSALQIASNRFHLAWVTSGIIAMPILINTPIDHVAEIFFLGITCISLPILLLQWGITLCRPLPAALIIATLPAIVWASESAIH